MNRFKLGKEFFVSLLLAAIAAITLLCVLYQQNTIDKACDAIDSFDQVTFEEYADDVWYIDGHGNDKETMLMAACKAGNIDAIEYLLTRGAKANYNVPGQMTPLELLCGEGYDRGYDALVLLLEHGAKQTKYTVKPPVFHLADTFQSIPNDLKEAATAGAILLLQNGAPIQYDGTTLLHMAAKANMSSLFYTIVHTSEGLSLINNKDRDGKTPWEVATRNGSVGVQQVIRNLETEYQEVQTEAMFENDGSDEDFDLDAFIDEYYTEPIE